MNRILEQFPYRILADCKFTEMSKKKKVMHFTFAHNQSTIPIKCKKKKEKK